MKISIMGEKFNEFKGKILGSGFSARPGCYTYDCLPFHL
jgi:hypothetical protein